MGNKEIADCLNDFADDRELLNCKANIEILRSAAAIIRKVESGELIELPCKVGDTIYKLWYSPCHFGNEWPDSMDCDGCEDVCDLKQAIFEFIVPSEAWILSHFKEINGSVYFLTEQAAREALSKKEE